MKRFILDGIQIVTIPIVLVGFVGSYVLQRLLKGHEFYDHFSEWADRIEEDDL